MDFVKQIASFLVKTNSLKFGIFSLSSGKESPYYIDLRILPSFPLYFKATIEAYEDAIQRNIGLDRFDYICSVPTTGLVYASSISYKIGKPLVYVRKEGKKYGMNNLLEGYLSPGAKVVILDDVITSGNSILDAVEAVRNNGGVVSTAIVLIDRLEGAEATLSQHDVKLISVSKISEIVNVLLDSGMLDDECLKTIKEYVKERA